jgi:hypothetical protein
MFLNLKKNKLVYNKIINEYKMYYLLFFKSTFIFSEKLSKNNISII